MGKGSEKGVDKLSPVGPFLYTPPHYGDFEWVPAPVTPLRPNSHSQDLGTLRGIDASVSGSYLVTLHLWRGRTESAWCAQHDGRHQPHGNVRHIVQQIWQRRPKSRRVLTTVRHYRRLELRRRSIRSSRGCNYRDHCTPREISEHAWGAPHPRRSLSTVHARPSCWAADPSASYAALLARCAQVYTSNRSCQREMR